MSALTGLVFSLFALTGCQAASIQPELSEDTAVNLLAISPQVYLAGEINHAKTAELASVNALVVDFRTQPEGTAQEARSMASSGVRYVNLPVSGASVDPATVASLTTLLSAAGDSPVVLHCRSGNRAAMLYAAHLIETGVKPEEARRAVSAAVTSSAIDEAIERYGEDH